MSSPRVIAVVVALGLVCSLPLTAQFTPQRQPGDPTSPMAGRDRTSPRFNDEDAPRTLSIAGSVRTTSNQPVSDAKIEVHDISTGAVVATGYTNFGGNFEVRELQQGIYEVTATYGVLQARERVELRIGEYNLNFRIADDSEGGRGPTVSVANLKVPGKAKSSLHKAQEYVEKGRLEDGRKELQKALQVYPTYAEAYTLLGIIDLDQQDTNGATASLEKAITYDPNSALAFMALGGAYNVTRKYDDAVRALNSAIRLAPQSWQAYFEMAKACLGKQDFSNALQQVTKAEQLATREFPTMHLVKANALLGLKEYGKAAAELETYLARNPQGPNAVEARQALEIGRAHV